MYRKVFEQALAEWYERVEAAVAGSDADGWDEVDHVLSAGFNSSRPIQTLFDWSGERRLRKRAPGTSNSALRCSRCSLRCGLFRAGNERRALPAPRSEQLLLTGYGALLSYFSDVPLIAGLLDRDPMTDAALEARLDHIRALFRAALEPTSPRT